MSQIEIKVPDIGDFKDVDVAEILVKPGDTVQPEQSLISLESDKASMEVPSPAGGVVTELKLKVGDKVSQGSSILVLDAVNTGARSAPAQPGAAAPAQPQPSAPGQMQADAARPPSPQPTVPDAALAAPARGSDLQCDVLVLGSGPGGYSAAFRAADLGLSVILVERYAALGGVCLNVGCIPSKALLHVAAVMDEAARLADHGVVFEPPGVDLDKLRAWKDKVVSRLTGGLAGMAKARKVTVVQGAGSFLDAQHLAVETTAGRQVLAFKNAIIAAGSEATELKLDGANLADDPRIVDSTGALELRQRPKRMLIIGGGIIGLEMATVYSTLGAKIDVVEMLDGLMAGADRDLVTVWQKFNARRFGHILLKTRTTRLEADRENLKVWFEGEQAPAEPQAYDMVLVSVGRTPNGHRIAADKAGVAVDEHGFIRVDSQMRTNVPHIFAIGDIAGQPMLAHKAIHEGHVAAEAAAGLKSHFDARVIPAVAYTDPELAWVGMTEDEAKKQGLPYGLGKFPWAASGRAIANGRQEGLTKLLFDEQTHRVIGGGIVGAGAGELISEIALAIEMGADATDIGKTIHPHPTLSEPVGQAAEAFEGICTDLMPARKA